MRAKLHFYESFKLMQNIFTIYLNDFCTKKYPHIKVTIDCQNYSYLDNVEVENMGKGLEHLVNIN